MTPESSGVDPKSPGPIEDGELRLILEGLGREIQRPLGTLREGLDRLLNEDDPPAPEGRAEHVRMMTGICDELLGLTRGYFDLAGIPLGARAVAPRPFTLLAFADELDRRFGDEVRGRGLSWTCGVVGADATVVADRDLCVTAVGALVDNAMKYTPGGGVVRLAVGSAPPGEWTIGVSDSGPGIPESEYEQVFQPFERLDREGRGAVAGKGLGLATCRAVSTLLGGRVTLGRSEEGGTAATVTLPGGGGPPVDGGPARP